MNPRVSPPVSLDLTSRARPIGSIALVEQAATLYRPAGRFAYHFARGKLGNDPLFATLVRLRAIPDARRLVDLGCGQGLLGAWLVATSCADIRGGIDPSPLQIDEYCGVDQSKNDIARARTALPGARIVEADLRAFDVTTLGPCDVITLFDVLHYLEPASQQRLLFSAHAALRDTGTLLLRIGDAASASASRWANAIDLAVCALRGHPRSRLHRRPIADWIALLDGIGFSVEVLDDDRAHAKRWRSSASFANVLLRATKQSVVPGEHLPSTGSARGQPIQPAHQSDFERAPMSQPLRWPFKKEHGRPAS